jgi:hypothetical protein
LIYIDLDGFRSFRRIRDKYEAEFRELENSEKQTKERFNQIRAQMTEFQGNYSLNHLRFYLEVFYL